MSNETHTQYQRELAVLIDALESRVESYEVEPTLDTDAEMQAQVAICQQMVDLAAQLIVRDDLDELVSVAQRLFPDGYKDLGNLVSEARTALDDPGAVIDKESISYADEKAYAINKLDLALDMLKSDEEIEEGWHQYLDDSALDED